MRPVETPWELDQSLKFQIHEANINLTNGQHREWFVVSLLPHPRVALSQQKIGTQEEALKIAMILHKTLIQDVERVQNIDAELQNICLEFQSLKKDRATHLEMREEVWCLKCKSQGHDKDHYPVFVNYVVGRGPMPIRLEAQVGPSIGPALWCTIYQVVGKHVKDNCHLLQKFVQTSQQLFYNFFKMMGHNERNCRIYKLMMERIPMH